MTRCVISAHCENRWCVGRTGYREFVCWDNAIVFDWFSNFCLDSLGSFNATFGLQIILIEEFMRSIRKFYDFKLWNPEFQIFLVPLEGNGWRSPYASTEVVVIKYSILRFVKHRFCYQKSVQYVSWYLHLFQRCWRIEL